MSAKLAFIAARAAEHGIRLMRRLLRVSPSWFHDWRAAAPKRAARQAARDVLAAKIRAIFEGSKRRYGAPRIHAELRAEGLRSRGKRLPN
ncbi:IS3 family transposase [Paracoccus ravus]|uniref:IS3 family transposase n=1 Tax=Paracoccus ravus TaxID=2447760 RepID=UPI00142F585F|nr:IS3 family transposase [Paracoccus ravus]